MTFLSPLEKTMLLSKWQYFNARKGPTTAREAAGVRARSLAILLKVAAGAHLLRNDVI